MLADAGSATKGFKYVSTAGAYTYDLNGNLTRDNHKTASLSYNYLNLPNYIAFDSGSDITMTYSADGEKLTKVAGGVTKNYVSGIEYTGANVEAIYHGEGRCTPNGTSFFYEYTIKDHLGNVSLITKSVPPVCTKSVPPVNHNLSRTKPGILCTVWIHTRQSRPYYQLV